MSKIKFKRDTAFRKTFFVPDSFAHPAKMDAQLLIWIVEHYTEAGEVILDPMAGSGTTMLACTLGRHCILVELEDKFCKMMRDNWELVKMRPQLGSTMGKCKIIQGEARQLAGVKLPSGTLCEEGRVQLPQPQQVDKIVTSPPYLEMKGNLHKDIRFFDHPTQKKTMNYPDTISREPFPNNPNNIGNLKSDSYLEAMLQVYQQCYKVLKLQGLMILVTKNFIRNKQVVRLDEDTIKLCEQAGFSFVERHERVLPSQSFWRVIYHQKHPEVEQIKSEDVLVFKKKEG